MESTAAETVEKYFTLTYKGELVPENKSFEITGELGYYSAAVVTIQLFAKLGAPPAKAYVSPDTWKRLAHLVLLNPVVGGPADYDTLFEIGYVRYMGVEFHSRDAVADSLIEFEPVEMWYNNYPTCP